MNAKLSSPSLLLTALLCLGLGSVQAENPSVPSYINYQGSVTDSNGLPLGANGTVQDPVAEPTNYKVIFRISMPALRGCDIASKRPALFAARCIRRRVRFTLPPHCRRRPEKQRRRAA